MSVTVPESNSSSPPSPTLILHLDVNKTLIFTDIAAGHSLEGLINSTIASRTYGTVDYSVQPPKWIPPTVRRTSTTTLPGPTDSSTGSSSLSSLPSTSPSATTTKTINNTVDQHLYSYDGYVQEILYPYKNTQTKDDGSTPLTSEEKDEIIQHNTHLRQLRIGLTTTFTEPGREGENFRDEYTKIYDELRLSPEALHSCTRIPDLDFYRHLSIRFILPAYFYLLLTLIEQKRKFLILFRTFGSDVVNVITEHNLYVQGNHPLYPLPYPNDTEFRTAMKSLHVPLPYGTATMIRQGIIHPTDSKLVTIVSSDHKSRTCNLVSFPNDYKQPHVGVIMGYREIYNYFLSTLPSSSYLFSGTPTDHTANKYGYGAVMGIRDDYTAWFTNAQKGHAGKLMPIDIDDSSVHSIFFDDNCGDDRDAFVTMGPNLPQYGVSPCIDPRIIDARNIADSKSLNWPDIRYKYAVLVDPYSAVIDKEYFVKAIAACERNRAMQQ